MKRIIRNSVIIFLIAFCLFSSGCSFSHEETEQSSTVEEVSSSNVEQPPTLADLNLADDMTRIDRFFDSAGPAVWFAYDNDDGGRLVMMTGTEIKPIQDSDYRCTPVMLDDGRVIVFERPDGNDPNARFSYRLTRDGKTVREWGALENLSAQYGISIVNGEVFFTHLIDDSQPAIKPDLALLADGIRSFSVYPSSGTPSSCLFYENGRLFKIQTYNNKNDLHADIISVSPGETSPVTELSEIVYDSRFPISMVPGPGDSYMCFTLEKGSGNDKGYNLVRYAWVGNGKLSKTAKDTLAINVCDFCISDGRVFYVTADSAAPESFSDYENRFVYYDCSGQMILYKSITASQSDNALVLWSDNGYNFFTVTDNNPAMDSKTHKSIYYWKTFVSSSKKGFAIHAAKKTSSNLIHTQLCFELTGSEPFITEIQGTMAYGKYLFSDRYSPATLFNEEIK
ncbi:MAG: hypothetical protein IJU46_06725 [Clostridia bacterium]|nr:hypothetical protein [Clostridia bacterium]